MSQADASPRAGRGDALERAAKPLIAEFIVRLAAAGIADGVGRCRYASPFERAAGRLIDALIDADAHLDNVGEV